jgi:hypothetical protein
VKIFTNSLSRQFCPLEDSQRCVETCLLLTMARHSLLASGGKQVTSHKTGCHQKEWWLCYLIHTVKIKERCGQSGRSGSLPRKTMIPCLFCKPEPVFQPKTNRLKQQLDSHEKDYQTTGTIYIHTYTYVYQLIYSLPKMICSTGTLSEGGYQIFQSLGHKVQADTDT